MEDNKKRRTGRYPKNNKRTHCVMVRFDDVEWARFLTLYEQSGVYAKAVFVKSRVFGETFKVVKVDKTMVDFYEKLSSFHAQFRGVAVNYNQVVKELRSHFSEKKAMALLYRLESMTRQMMEQGQQIVALAKISAAQDGEKLYFEKVEGLTSPIDYSSLRDCPELAEMEYFQNPQGSGRRSLSSISHSIPILTIS